MTDFLTLYNLTLALAFLAVIALDAWLIARDKKPPCD